MKNFQSNSVAQLFQLKETCLGLRLFQSIHLQYYPLTDDEDYKNVEYIMAFLFLRRFLHLPLFSSRQIESFSSHNNQRKRLCERFLHKTGCQSYLFLSNYQNTPQES